MPVGQMLSSMSSQEITEWGVYFTLKAADMELAQKSSENDPNATMGGY